VITLVKNLFYWGFKNTANQREDRKILFSDWLFQFLPKTLEKSMQKTPVNFLQNLKI
jgi:hypothetical protein